MASPELRIVVQALDRTIELVIKKLVLDIVANLQAQPQQGGTPVDTGWARANWIPKIGSPRTSPAGSPENLPSDSATGVAEVVLGYKVIRGPVFISNNVPYIVRLNEGHSGQAPRGFVQNAIAKAVGSLLWLATARPWRIWIATLCSASYATAASTAPCSEPLAPRRP